jgi:glyoxylase-like metal-dependent hydrolase (beta-lactamase superfamily II)
MQIFPLSEGAFSIDATKQFVPFNKATDDIQERPRGSLLVEVQPFLVKTESDIIVLDTGLGFEENGILQIQKNVKDLGIEPEEVTIVLLSHLHKDHSSGMKRMVNGELVLSFPNAKYYVNDNEYKYAMGEESSSYVKREIEWIGTHPNIIFTPDSGAINEFIKYEVCGGHSKFHQVFWIEEDGEIVFFGGDVAPQHQQMRNKLIAKYDFDGRRSMELRQEWWEKAVTEHWTFLFYHDIKTPTIAL